MGGILMVFRLGDSTEVKGRNEMLEKLKDVPPGVEALRAVGKVSKEDYAKIFEPLVEEAWQKGNIRFLYEFGPEFQGFTPGGAWEDAKVGLRAVRLFDGCAIVSDIRWIRESTRFVGFLMPCPVRVFGNQERDKAIDWLSSLPESANVSPRLIPESGVIVVEVKEPLRTQDFDALAFTADAWIEAHGGLRGLVIHVREFPGWANIGSLRRHLRFVRNLHRRVTRVALATDSKLAGLLPRLAKYVVRAEVKSFTYDELDDAIAWAGEPDNLGRR